MESEIRLASDRSRVVIWVIIGCLIAAFFMLGLAIASANERGRR